ncbi:MAG: hypothetical protein JXR95_06875 [Deltaproteobacteria bacterium]|nr:hypothetical protein [Deltaproteobacteria bacterium]
MKKDTEKEKKYTGYKVYKRNFSSNTNPEKISSKGYTSKYTPPKIEKQYIAPKEKPAGKEKEFSKNYEVKHIKPAYLPPIPKNIKKDCSGGECKSETSNIGQFNIIN